MKYYSQSGQDKWADQFFNSKKNGFFIEVGAYDGIQTSNTYIFEKDLDWDGICIEANPQIFNSLVKNRKSKNINIAINNYQGECFFGVDKVSNQGNKVLCNTLNNILVENNCPKVIDYLSLDIEGFEFIALESLDFDYFEIGLITVEHNSYFVGENEKNKIFDLLNKNGFTRTNNDVLCEDTNPMWYKKPYEDWYVNNKLLQQ
jgi:FkbM family methyltransferase